MILYCLRRTAVNKNRTFIIIELILVETRTPWPAAAQAESNQCKNQCKENDNSQHNANNSSSIQFISCIENNNISHDISYCSYIASEKLWRGNLSSAWQRKAVWLMDS